MALKVKGCSFVFGAPAEAAEVSFDDFFSWMHEQNGDLWPYNRGFSEDEPPEISRKLFIEQSDDYWAGILISAKNNRFNHFMEEDKEGNVTIKAVAREGDPPVDLNIFCIRKDSVKGIYSHYQTSTCLDRFLKDLWADYKTFVNIKKSEALNIEGARKKRIQKLFSTYMKNLSGPLYTPSRFDDLIKRLDQIEEVTFTTYQVDSESDAPVGDKVKNRHCGYRFVDNTTLTQSILNWIKDVRDNAFSKKAGLQEKQRHIGKVSGIDKEGSPFTVNFERTMEDWLNYEYDDLGSIKINELFEHFSIKDIIKRLKAENIFKPTPPTS